MLIIFDCDGVLVDSELIALEILSEIMGEHRRPMSVAECQDAFMGMHSPDIVRAIEARIGQELPGGVGAMRARMIERLKRELQAIPGVADALRRLPGPRCVASSSDVERIALTLELSGLAEFFAPEHIFSGTDVARGKPAPDLFLHAASVMGVSPEACVVVEDSINGVRAGVAAGMAVVGFAGGSHANADTAERLRAAGADPVITSMAELPGVLAAFEGDVPTRRGTEPRP